MTTSMRRPALSVVGDSLLDDVLEEVANRLQAGEAVDYAAILAKYPEHAESLRRLLPAVEVMAEFGVSASRLAARGVPTGMGPLETGLGELGDFRILREIGRGGMGVVYEAEQMSLGRRVALKVLPFAAALDSHQLQRFKTEAQAAAQLHHTNVVPVYWVGCERGVHYYAMQFIEGQTLAQAIAERRRMEAPPPPAGRGATTPSPVVGEGGPAGRMRGSAPSPLVGEGAPQGRMGGSSAQPDPVPAETSDRTRRGSLDPAETSDRARRGSPDPVETSDRARRGSPDPAETADRRSPIPDDSPAPRRSTGPVPSSRSREFFRTAATLGIQAAEALDHAHKFGIVHRDIKPANLLLDIQGNLWITDFGLARLQDDAGLTITGDLLGTLRYMSPEQALAKRGYLDHRTDIYSLGATLYELVALRPAIDGQDRQEVLRKIAQDEPMPPRRLNPAIPRELETILLKAMSKEPESRYATAQELADDLRRYLEHKPIRAKRLSLAEQATKWARRHTQVVASASLILILAVVGLAAGAAVLASKQVEVVRQRDRARKAVDDMYTQVAEKWLSDQPLLGEVQRDFLGKALAFYEEFVREPGTVPDLGRALRRVGQIQAAMNRREPALAAFRRAAEIFTNLSAADPGLPEFRCELATCLSGLGNEGRYYGSNWSSHRRALAIRRALADEFPGVTEYRRELAASYHDLWHCPDPVEAEVCLSKSLELWEAIVAEFPDEPDDRCGLGSALLDLGYLRRDAGRAEDAERCYRRAAGLFQPIVKRFPGRPKFRLNLAWSRQGFGLLLLEARPAREQRPRVWDRHDLGELPAVRLRSSDAEAALREAESLFQALADDFPDLAVYREFLAGTRSHLADLMRADGRLDDAQAYYLKVAPVVAQLAAEDATAIHLRRNEVLLSRGLAEVLRGQARLAEAEQNYRRAVELSRRLVTDFPRLSHSARQILAQRLTELGYFLARSGRGPEAEHALGEAFALEQDLSGQRPDSAGDLEAFARFLANCPIAHFRDASRAVAMAKKALDLAPGEWAAWNTLGMAEYRAGAWDEAIKILSRSMDLSPGGSPADWFFLAMACWQQGDKSKARSWYERAVHSMEKNNPQDEELQRFRAEAAALLGMTEHPTSTETKEQVAPQRSKP